MSISDSYSKKYLAARIIKRENITAAGGVPSMVMDLIESSLDSDALESLGCGGAPSAETMPKEVQRRFKNVESYVLLAYLNASSV